MSDALLTTLLETAHAVGQDVSLIQGGGGNISIKTPDRRMYIKASGTILRDMSLERGYATVDQVGRVLDPERQQRPSMEMPMHLILPRCVIHTHSVYANIYNCMVGGERHLLDLFADEHPLYIPYVHPGAALAESIDQAARAHQARYQTMPALLFLENHGMITCHADPIQALALTQRVHRTLAEYLQTHYSTFRLFAPDAQVSQPTHCFFPDAAVFVQSSLSAGVKEIWSANAYIAEMITMLGGQARYLTVDHIYDLQHMESEQYRLRQ